MKKKTGSQLSLEDKEEQYRIIFESASDGMIISDIATGRVVDAVVDPQNWTVLKGL